MKSWDADPVVLTVAPTGSDVTRANNPNIPYTPEEIAQSSIEAAEAGATVVHIHVREDDGTPSGRADLFAEVIRRVREDSQLITMATTGGSNDMGIEERTGGISARPEMVGVESGSMNFGDDTFITPPAAAHGIIERSLAIGAKLEVEAFDVGHVVQAVRWIDEGRLPAPLHINLVFGVTGGIDATPEALAAMVRPLPPETFWTVTCIGRHQQRMLALGLLNGAPGIRTGLEDAVYLSKGVFAPSNAALVQSVVALTRALGREVATPEQARSLLGISS